MNVDNFCGRKLKQECIVTVIGELRSTHTNAPSSKDININAPSVDNSLGNQIRRLHLKVLTIIHPIKKQTFVRNTYLSVQPLTINAFVEILYNRFCPIIDWNGSFLTRLIQLKFSRCLSMLKYASSLQICATRMQRLKEEMKTLKQTFLGSVVSSQSLQS